MIGEYLENMDNDGQNIRNGLLLESFLETKKEQTWFAVIWLIGVWVLLIFNHPGWMLAFGSAYALITGKLLGGRDTIEGCEEMTFSLPPTRKQRFRGHACFGLCILLGFTVIGLAAIYGNVPQKLWGLFVESGFTEPNPGVSRPWVFYSLAISVPVCLFITTFVTAAVTTSRRVMQSSRLIGVLLTAGVFGIGYGVESILWHQVRHLVPVPLLLVVSILVFVVGENSYMRKEGRNQPVSGEDGSYWGVWMVIGTLFVVAVLAFFLLFTLPK